MRPRPGRSPGATACVEDRAAAATAGAVTAGCEHAGVRRAAATAVLLTFCVMGCSDDGEEAAPSTTRGPPPSAASWHGFGADTSSIAVLPNGDTTRGITLRASRGFGPGDQVTIGLHPATRSVEFDAPRLPDGGTLVACGVSDADCIELRSGRAGQRHDLVPIDSHTTLRLRGTWTAPVAVEAVEIRYEAADDYFSVELEG